MIISNVRNILLENSAGVAHVQRKESSTHPNRVSALVQSSFFFGKKRRRIGEADNRKACSPTGNGEKWAREINKGMTSFNTS